MGQEAENKINFVCLRAIVDGAIKSKDTSDIEAMDDEKQEKQLKYMQKYAELLASKDESINSYKSISTGNFWLL